MKASDKHLRPARFASLLAMFAVSCICINATGQQDRVFFNTGSPSNGKVDFLNADQFTLDGKTLNISDVKKFSFAGASKALGRVMDDIKSGQFEEAMAGIQKIDEVPTSKMALHEYEFAKAMVMGKLALRGGQVSTQQAGAAVGGFLRKYPNSFRTYPLADIYGQLLVGINQMELAEAEFKKLAASSSPDYQLKGLFDLGQAQLLTGKFAEAGETFTRLESHELNDTTAQQYKLMALCQKSKAIAIQDKSQVDAIIAKLEKIIATENPDNKQLFAYCYNALGTCHRAKGEDKAAAIAFLHTDLLFSTEADAHAEALFNLCSIWPDLEETDRANRARQNLGALYANSFWKAKLDALSR